MKIGGGKIKTSTCKSCEILRTELEGVLFALKKYNRAHYFKSTIEHIEQTLERSEFAEIVCPYLTCAAGMGVAGNLQCFLHGDYRDKECKEYEEERGD